MKSRVEKSGVGIEEMCGEKFNSCLKGDKQLSRVCEDTGNEDPHQHEQKLFQLRFVGVPFHEEMLKRITNSKNILRVTQYQ